MIRSIKHYFLSYTNIGKADVVSDFLSAYRQAVQSYIDYIWVSSFYYKNGDLQFSLIADRLHMPYYIDYQLLDLSHLKLSARALSAASDQAASIVKGRVAIRNKLLYIIKKRKEENLPTEKWEEKLLKGQAVLTKPELKDNFSAELSSKNIELKQTDSGHFQFFLSLGSTGFKNIHIPIKLHTRDQKWISENGQLLTGILLSKNNIQLRYEVSEAPKKQTGRSVGIDTGKLTIATLSDGQTTPKTDNHGHSLDSILEVMKRKKKGSKTFLRTQDHRKNFINWSVNQLNFTDVKEIKLEHIDNLFFQKRSSRLMSHFTNSLIERKLVSLAEETGVLLSLQSSTYKSQRCSGCCLVRKSNRKGKIYNCSGCGLVIDADLNSAINNEIDLPAIPFWLRQQDLNRTGFFWKENGFFDLAGQELIVPDADKKKNM